MSWSADKQARAVLLQATGGGHAGLAQQVAEVGSEQVLAMIPRVSSGAIAARVAAADASQLEAATQRCGLRFVVPGEPDWPSEVNSLAEAAPGRVSDGVGGVPLGLWLSGQWPTRSTPGADDRDRQAEAPWVAMVGSRAASPYGERVASDLAAELAIGRGAPAAVIVSGGAYGIDAAAHRGALAAEGGATVAVLAGGLDEYYPRGNAALLTQVRHHGLLISEVAPGSRPTKAGFLARNRIIAALASVTVVVEAAHRSGALNTAAWANRIHRVVAAVPGAVSSSLSGGVHRLIQHHEAELVTSAADITALWRGVHDTSPSPEPLIPAALLDGLEGELLAVREALQPRRATPVDELTELTGLSVPLCLAALADLADRGLAASRAQGWVLARPR